MCVLDVVKLFE